MSTTTKLYLKFWWPFYLFALLFIAITIALLAIDIEDSLICLFAIMDMLSLSAATGMLTHRISLIRDVKAGYVICDGDEDVELDNVLRKIYYEYLTGHPYENQETIR